MNRSAAVVPNTFLNLYPRPGLQQVLDEQPELLDKIFEALDQISTEHLVSNGRTYGGGLHKMEPKELENLRIDLGELTARVDQPHQGRLFSL